MRRVLATRLSLRDQALLLLAASTTPVKIGDLVRWLEPSTSAYLRRILNKLHGERMIELSEINNTATILPPGSQYVENDLIDGGG